MSLGAEGLNLPDTTAYDKTLSERRAARRGGVSRSSMKKSTLYLLMNYVHVNDMKA